MRNGSQMKVSGRKRIPDREEKARAKAQRLEQVQRVQTARRPGGWEPSLLS
jgi:hypothetical protein